MSEWYYALNNEQKGPINESELKENLAAHKLPADSLVWKDGMDNWTPANQVPALSFRQPPAPAKIQPTTVIPKTSAVTAPASTPATETPAASNPDSTKPVDLSSVMGKPEALEVTVEDAEKNKIAGVFAYVPFLFWLPLLLAKDSPFGKYHANQGLALFLLEIAFRIFLAVIGLTSFILPGDISWLLGFFQVINLVPLVLIILGIINAANGKCVPLPVIGGVKLIK